MRKVLYWGAGREYLFRGNLMKYEIFKHNMEPVAICSRDHYADEIEGLKVITKEESADYSFDYIIVFNDLRFESIKKEIIQLGYDAETVINSKIFELPDFDFMRYVSLIEKPVSIVCNDCWGAVMYHNLGLKFSSPFVLQWISNEDFFLLLEKFDYYMSKTFTLERDIAIGKNLYPMASLGGEILINCNHSPSFADAKKDWERRIQRMNKKNLYVKVDISNEEERERFIKLPFENKTGFTFDPSLVGDNIVYLPRYTWRTKHKVNVLGYDFTAYLRDIKWFAHSIDILKMLNGSAGFLKEN